MRRALAIAAFLALCLPALAQNMPAASATGMTLALAAPLEAGKPTSVTLHLQKPDGTLLDDAALRQVHAQRLHLLVVDPSLTDYHHIHPVYKNGVWTFPFTPAVSNGYRVFADITPEATGKQEYVFAPLGDIVPADVLEAPSLTVTQGDFTFALRFDSAPRSDEFVIARLKITKKGVPFAGLEPVLGAFAHVVGFTADGASVVHVHPAGDEPRSDKARGGPRLDLHITPQKPGFVKFFAQFRIEGKDVFVPFGVNVTH
jgi:hypothetical protein